MRLITAKINKNNVIGILNSEKTHMAAINSLGFDFVDMLDLIAKVTQQELEKLSNLDFSTAKDVYALSEIEFLSPIPKPMHDIICLGVNYAAHAAEFGREAPAIPVYFGKRASSTTGHLETFDGHLEVDTALDYEAELAVIIGKQAKKIKPEEVEEHIFGYSVFNDLTLRDVQKRHNQWFLGKGVDGFAAMGPWILTKDELPMPFSLSISSRVNGELRQSSNTDLMVHGINKVVSEMSQVMTLYPGDIIATGTPSGVGMGFDPPKMLKKGDVVECEVEGVGVLRNTVG